jgi:hypothetical protein
MNYNLLQNQNYHSLFVNRGKAGYCAIVVADNGFWKLVGYQNLDTNNWVWVHRDFSL